MGDCLAAHYKGKKYVLVGRVEIENKWNWRTHLTHTDTWIYIYIERERQGAEYQMLLRKVLRVMKFELQQYACMYFCDKHRTDMSRYVRRIFSLFSKGRSRSFFHKQTGHSDAHLQLLECDHTCKG
mgnify:CR=1 FL=1